MSRWGKPTKNSKKIDPRYFLNEAAKKIIKKSKKPDNNPLAGETASPEEDPSEAETVSPANPLAGKTAAPKKEEDPADMPSVPRRGSKTIKKKSPPKKKKTIKKNAKQKIADADKKRAKEQAKEDKIMSMYKEGNQNLTLSYLTKVVREELDKLKNGK